MPLLHETPIRLLSLFPLAHVILQLPPLFAVAAEAPQLQRADLGHLAVQMHRHGPALLAWTLQRGRKRRQLVDLAFPLLDHQTSRILPANGRAEEADLGLFAAD